MKGLDNLGGVVCLIYCLLSGFTSGILFFGLEAYKGFKVTSIEDPDPFLPIRSLLFLLGTGLF